jgi:hypothetical protein
MQINFNPRFVKLILILVFTIAIFNSCKFFDDIENVRQDWIVVGNSSGLNHKVYEALQVGTRSANSLFVDVDSDGKNDFEFFTQSTISAGLGYESDMEMKCLNDSFYVSCNELYDSLYLQIDTSIVYKDNLVEVYIWNTFSCSKINENYKPYGKETRFYPMRYVVADTLFGRDYFISKTFKLRFDPPSYPISMSGVRKNDTITYKSSSLKYCYLLPDNTESFIGFKKIEGNIEYLGWLKISIINDYQLTILESAIQKK